MSELELTLLLRLLLSLPHKTEWVEFKHNNADPEEIGEYLSALANAAALHEKERAYIVWGIADGTRQVEGTSFRPRQRKMGNEELENWLLRGLTPNKERALWSLFDRRPFEDGIALDNPSSEDVLTLIDYPQML